MRIPKIFSVSIALILLFTLPRSGIAQVATVTVAATDAAASESGTPATNTGTFTITRTGATTSPLTVNYTIGGTAIGGSD